MLGEFSLGELAAKARHIRFTFSGRRELEPLRNQSGEVAGVLIRTQQPIEGRIELSAKPISGQVFRTHGTALQPDPA